MSIKIYKLLILIIFITFTSPLYSKNNDIKNFNIKNFTNYLSAQISYNSQQNAKSLKYFNLSKKLKNKHTPYLKHYIFSLILDKRVNEAIKELKINVNKKNSDFFEAYFLLILEDIKKNNYKKANKHLLILSKFKDIGTIENIIYQSLKEYLYLFQNNEIPKYTDNFGKLTIINKTFQNCYLGEKNTKTYFINLINSDAPEQSRYTYFYINYLINNGNYDEVKKITDKIDILNSSLLILQSKKWIDKKNFKRTNKFFSCKNKTDILGEFFFLISSLYANEKVYDKSNFYLNISQYLNPKFKYNLTLMIENFYANKDYTKIDNLLNIFSKEEEVYYWYKVKKKSQIILKESDQQKSLNFINSEFKKIKKPSIKILFDMANVNKSFKNYKVAINFYNQIIPNLNKRSLSYGEILYRRGGSYERVKEYKKADKDLIESIDINPNDSYALNYLAYSWLERSYKIDQAIEMLERAYSQNNNDPYILDSIGWAYYLTGNFLNAEKLLNQAIQIMPNDPVINDHYADVLWKLDRKIQARYFWQSVLNLEEIENDLKKKVKYKIINGPDSI